ncbi:MAG: hypothetical protein IT406_00085 [Candidatus Yanofskybacteria bacterium]|nr:hypothetical protein [Candidatus Yanofskybacteria bacterium]
MRFSLPQLVSGLAADASAVALDLPGGGYDRLHQLLEQRALPSGNAARLTVAAVAILASRLVQQQIGPVGPIGTFLREISEDGVREEAKRILERVRDVGSQESGASTNTVAPFWDLDTESRRSILEFYGSLDPQEQDRLRTLLMRATALELAALAGLPREQQHLVLSLFAPPHTPRPSLSSRIGAALNGACQSAAATLWPWNAERSRP